MLLSLARITKFALQNFWRNIWLSIVTITIIVLTLFSLTSLIIINVTTDHAIAVVKNKFNISLTFRPEVALDKVQEVRTALDELPYVADISLIEPEQALTVFKQTHADEPEVLGALEALGHNPFGATLTIRPTSIEYYRTLVEHVGEMNLSKQIEKTDTESYERIVARLEALSARVETFGLGVSALFAFIALLIVFNAIRIGIYSHRDEIGIMRLVGATDAFIRGPFLVEALMYTVISCAIFWGAFLPLAKTLSPQLSYFFGDIGFDLMGYLMVNLWNIMGFEFILMLALTMLSSVIAMAKYLKV